MSVYPNLGDLFYRYEQDPSLKNIRLFKNILYRININYGLFFKKKFERKNFTGAGGGNSDGRHENIFSCLGET